MRLLDPKSDAATIESLAGGKAEGLHRLATSGFRVPDWFAIGTDGFARFAEIAGLTQAIDALGTATDLDAALSGASALRATILEASIPDDVAASIGDAYRSWGEPAVAVRSSGAPEDGAEQSFAGQFDSFLDVRGVDAVLDAVRRCWASAFSDRLVRYVFAHSNSVPVAGIAVVVQRLIAARVSGVVFTANPVTGSPDEIAISAVYGLGEGLVSGAVDADSYVVRKVDGALVSTHIGEKSEQYLPNDGHGASPVPVDPAVAEVPALTDIEIAELAALGRAVETASDVAQDIEWAIDDDGLWVLQSRPITSLGATTVAAAPAHRDDRALVVGAQESLRDNDTRIWDNSNIIESFSGITSPLTFTTAADIYGRVYRNYALSLRVPPAQLRQTDDWTPVLLGYFHGRVYYNLLHWYRMVGIAPGYPLNRRVLEVALGVDEPLDNAVAKTLHPFTFRNSLAKLRSRAITTATYAKRFATIDTMIDEFMTEFYRVYDEYDAVDYNSLPGDEVYRRYRTVEHELIDRWGPMMVLDAILLTSTGLLFILTKLFLPKAPEWFLYAVISPGADIESAEPAQAMRAMADVVRADPALVEFVNTTDPDKAYDALQASDWHEFAALVDDYIDRYGYRSLDELKLETPDLREDPASLFIMLRSALPDPTPSRRGDADDYLDAHLGGVRRRIYERLRGKAARCAAHRESLRFCRTRAFGMVKRMIRAMGRDLAARGIIDEFADVFYLRLDELRACYDAESSSLAAELAGTSAGSARSLVAARKAMRPSDAALVAPARFVTTGPAFGPVELARQGWVPLTDTPAAEEGDALDGTPSAQGVVEGVAVVVDSPRNVDGGILIAYRTDPGWVAALPSASALVIERGSPLTHVAIVARELGLTTVVQVKDVTKKIRTGMHIRVDGTNGTVTVLAPETTAARG